MQLLFFFLCGMFSHVQAQQSEEVPLAKERPWTHLEVRLKDGRVTTFSRDEIAAVQYRYPSARASVAIIGTWNWVSGQTLVIAANGTLEVFEGSRKINEGRWEDLGGNRYRFTHRDGGFIDTVAVSSDGHSLDGKNNSGNILHGSRKDSVRTAPQLAGTWNWVSGQTLVIAANGTLQVFEGSRKINEGRWENLGGNRYRFTHQSGGFVDTVTLSSDGRSLDGKNNSGYTLHGSRK